MPVDLRLLKSDVCLEESFSAMVHDICVARLSPLTNGVRQRLHEISGAERWTSRDHDLSKSAERSLLVQNSFPLEMPCHCRMCVWSFDSEFSACNLGYLLESTD